MPRITAIGEFDAYYQDVQKRIKDQQYPNRDLPKKGAEKIDITIVVDMLLTGFDAKYLNTLYVDKNLKHHGLIQAFSRTNRVLNAAKPYGHILDFRGQQANVDDAITLFSGARADQAKEIWLVDKAPVVIERLKAPGRSWTTSCSHKALRRAPKPCPTSRATTPAPPSSSNSKRSSAWPPSSTSTPTSPTNSARRLSTRCPKMTPAPSAASISKPPSASKPCRTAGDRPGGDDGVREPPGEYDRDAIDQTRFRVRPVRLGRHRLRLHHEPHRPLQRADAAQQEMSREQLIRLIRADAKFMDELDEITEYVRTLETGQPLTEEQVRAGYQRFKDERHAAELAAIADKYGLTNEALQAFVDAILERMIFDGEQLTDLMEPLELGWRERRKRNWR